MKRDKSRLRRRQIGLFLLVVFIFVLLVFFAINKMETAQSFVGKGKRVKKVKLVNEVGSNIDNLLRWMALWKSVWS